jgi:MFS family permease
MIQGLSVGGEYTSSMVFLVEHAPDGRRGLMGAVASCGTTLGFLTGAGLGAAIAAMMTTETLDTWGWRIPFLLGIVIGIFGFILRRELGDLRPVEPCQPKFNRQDVAGSLAAGRAARPAFRIRRGDVPDHVCLCGELAANRRRNFTGSRA